MNSRLTDIKRLEQISNQLHIQVVKILGRFGYGHNGGTMSIADIITVLYFQELKIDPENPHMENRDRFVLSKGHACLADYVALAELGYFAKTELDRPFETV